MSQPDFASRLEHDLAVEDVPLPSLKPYGRNARTHSRKQIAQIAESIRQFGFTNPILIDSKHQIIAGHGRAEAARLLGMPTVPAIRLEQLSEAQKRAYIIADNRLAELAGWDREILAIELQGLIELDEDFDVTITGFEMGEIDVMLRGLEGKTSESDESDDVPAIDKSKPAVTRLGDIWAIGQHRIICGDSTDSGPYAQLLGGERAELVFTDPPYNARIGGHVTGLGDVKHREFAMASGEMSETEFTAFLKAVFEQLVAHTRDGAIHFICMDWRHISELMAAAKPVYSSFKNLCVWTKTNGGMGSLYRSQHELVFVFKSGQAPHTNNVELGRFGRYRTNVWSHPGINSFGAHRDEDLATHPTVKPVALVADAILDCSVRRGIVLDAFAGSGTTLVAAHRTGRRGYGIELDPHYCDTIARRMIKVTGVDALLQGTDTTFAKVEAKRPGARGGAGTVTRATQEAS
jgi:DNA modification methylase